MNWKGKNVLLAATALELVRRLRVSSRTGEALGRCHDEGSEPLDVSGVRICCNVHKSPHDLSVPRRRCHHERGPTLLRARPRARSGEQQRAHNVCVRQASWGFRLRSVTELLALIFSGAPAENGKIIRVRGGCRRAMGSTRTR